MEAIYLDLHIHTSLDANNPNIEYDVAELIRQIKKHNNDSKFLISLTDHNMINKSAYIKAKALGVNLLLGAELHIKLHEDVKSYHSHIYFNLDVTEENIDNLNLILDNLYPNKLPNREADTIPDIQKIINSFDEYEFMLLPHGSQRHGAFNYSLRDGERVDTAINRSIYYNQFDGFTARSNTGLEATKSYFQMLGIGEFVNLLTCSDNYSPAKYPEPHSKDAGQFVPTWMFAEPTFEGIRLSLSESSRLVYQDEKPEKKSDHITHVQLLNERIDIDVVLTEGLNVVIGGSSSGKTLFVDSVVRAIHKDFEGTKYDRFGVDQLTVSNPSEMRPYYVSQNFIAENINNNEEKSIDKIEILKNIFPGDDKINRQITEALNSLNIDINDMLQCVDTIEKSMKSLNALPHPGKMMTYGNVQKNIFIPILPSKVESALIEYPEDQYNKDLKSLEHIMTFLKNNPFVDDADSEIMKIINLLEKAKNVYILHDKVNNYIVDKKKAYDEELLKIQGLNQEHVENRERLLKLVSSYIVSLNRFIELKNKIIKTKHTYVTNVVESMGHKLSIQNNFKFDKDIFLSCLNKYLNYKFQDMKDVVPENMFSSKFKQRPLVESFLDLSNKIQNVLVTSNNKSYTIVSRYGENFLDLSPGWKTAIILDLILGYKDDNAPIIIDQPEDNLAVRYINNDLVETIKAVKDRKQIILVSHNATIPMMADAQNIILCKNEGGKITIRSSSLEGCIGTCKVLDIIADQTDGGKASIKKRVKKYNLKKFN